MDPHRLRIALEEQPVLLLRAAQRGFGLGADVNLAEEIADLCDDLHQHGIGLFGLLVEKLEHGHHALIADDRNLDD